MLGGPDAVLASVKAPGKKALLAELSARTASLLKLDERRLVVVDTKLATTVPTIYAAGDVIGWPSLASTSMEQGRVAVCHAFGFPYKTKVESTFPYGLYTIPEASTALVGTPGLALIREDGRRVPTAVGLRPPAARPRPVSTPIEDHGALVRRLSTRLRTTPAYLRVVGREVAGGLGAFSGLRRLG